MWFVMFDLQYYGTLNKNLYNDSKFTWTMIIKNYFGGDSFYMVADDIGILVPVSLSELN